MKSRKTVLSIGSFAAFLLLLLPLSGIVFAQQGDGGEGSTVVSLISSLCSLVIGVIVIIGMWKVFAKADKPGFAAIIPIWNILVILQIVGRPTWWIILFLIPGVNIVIDIIVSLDLAKSFGKGTGFGIGLIFLPFIFYPMLGFGSDTYQGPAAAQA